MLQNWNHIDLLCDDIISSSREWSLCCFISSNSVKNLHGSSTIRQGESTAWASYFCRLGFSCLNFLCTFYTDRLHALICCRRSLSCRNMTVLSIRTDFMHKYNVDYDICLSLLAVNAYTLVWWSNYIRVHIWRHCMFYNWDHSHPLCSMASPHP
jgi:hypothetical protein